MSSHQIEFTFTDQGLEMNASTGFTKIPWSRVTDIWQRPNYWMIFTSSNLYMTLPIQTLSLQDQRFILSKIRT
ncbi:YcxB family protein [Brucellaceae bacterium C25G]